MRCRKSLCIWFNKSRIKMHFPSLLIVYLLTMILNLRNDLN